MERTYARNNLVAHSSLVWMIVAIPALWSCSSGSSDIVACTDCEDVDATGNYQVTARVTGTEGENCQPGAAGQSVVGTVDFVHPTPTSIVGTDEDGSSATGSLDGNTATLSFSLFGATETWALRFSEDGSRFVGDLSVSAPGCVGLGTLSGVRLGPVVGLRAEGLEPVALASAALGSDGAPLPGGETRVVPLEDGGWMLLRGDGSVQPLSEGALSTARTHSILGADH